MKAQADALMILGPTASGKTALALEIAKEIPSEIISLDSALVYRHMDIGTAKPTKEEMAAVPHHLIDIIEPTETYSVANFIEDAERLIPQIRTRKRLPLIVGGTMLYAKGLRDGLSDLPQTTDELRQTMNDRLQAEGIAALYAELQQKDPVTADRLAPADTQRICRALEVYEMTGKPLSSYHGQTKGTDWCLDTFALLPPDRAELHRRIEWRFDQMLENGFLDEVRALMQYPGLTINHTSMRSVGYRQAWEYLEGLTDFDAFHLAGVAATRQLAKRQITWLRSMKDVPQLDPAEPATRELLMVAARKVYQAI